MKNIADENNPIKNQTKKKSLPQVPYTEGSDLLGFYNKWVSSPEYARRLQANQYSPEMQSNRLSALSNLVFSADTSSESIANPPANKISKAFVHINPLQAIQLGTTPKTVRAHETSHAIGAVPDYMNPFVGINEYERGILSNSVTKPKPIDTNSTEYHNWKHLKQPHEIKADLDASRFNLFEKGIYDITTGDSFGKTHLEKAKEILKDDSSFKRLLDQVGEEKYIELMNTIAMNQNNTDTFMAAYGGMINPMNEQYSLGGILQGAGKGAMMGAKLGTIIPGIGNVVGAIGGGIIGGAINLFKGNRDKRNQEEADALLAQQKEDQINASTLANMNYGFINSSNLPMANGGMMSSGESPVGSFSLFPVGGTHETNPYGGIPQGTNPNGKLRTVEAKETKYKFKDGEYIFSNRLTL